MKSWTQPTFPHLATSLLSHLSHLATSLPSHLSQLATSLPVHLSQFTTFPTTNRSLQIRNVLPLGRQDKHVCLIVRHESWKLMKAGWWGAPLALRDLAKAISITRNKISYCLIKPKPLLCTPACGYGFHALAVHPHDTFTVYPVTSAFGIRPYVCGWAFLRKQLTC